MTVTGLIGQICMFPLRAIINVCIALGIHPNVLTFVGVRRAGLSVGAAVKTALAADTISILVMEVVDNAILLMVPGAMEAHLDSALFWGALAVALAIAFVVTVPVNKAMIDRGRGHAVVHEMHHAHH